jgi:hypothetical protein
MAETQKRQRRKHTVVDGKTLNKNGSLYKCPVWNDDTILHYILGLELWLKESPKNRHIEEYFNNQGVNFKSFREALVKNNKFLNQYEYCKTLCKINYVKLAEENKINASIAKMLLVSNFDYTSDRTSAQVHVTNQMEDFLKGGDLDLQEDE